MSDDRTSEFFSLARSLPPTQSIPQKPATAAPSSDLRDFHSTAADISRDIASTSGLLTELTDVVRHQSSAVAQQQQGIKMNELVVRIKNSIENLHSRLDDASKFVKHKKRTQAGQQAANLVDGLQEHFAGAAADFQKVLQERTAGMQDRADLQKQVYGDDMEDVPDLSLAAPPPVYSSSGPPGAASPFPTLDLTSGLMPAGQSTGSGLPRPHGIRGGMYGGSTSSLRQRSTGGGSLYESAPLTPLDIQRQELEQQQQQLIPDQDYLQQRAEAMSTVESQIAELGTVFNKLAAMVSEHNELVERVDSNVQDADTNINLSMAVLTDTFENLRSGRNLALRLFSVLVIFIIVFLVFFA